MLETASATRIEPLGTHAERKARLEALRTAFTGLDTEYPLVDGSTTPRTYLDSAASTLRCTVARCRRRRCNAGSRRHCRGTCVGLCCR